MKIKVIMSAVALTSLCLLAAVPVHAGGASGGPGAGSALQIFYECQVASGGNVNDFVDIYDTAATPNLLRAGVKVTNVAFVCQQVNVKPAGDTDPTHFFVPNASSLLKCYAVTDQSQKAAVTTEVLTDVFHTTADGGEVNRVNQQVRYLCAPAGIQP